MYRRLITENTARKLVSKMSNQEYNIGPPRQYKLDNGCVIIVNREIMLEGYEWDGSDIREALNNVE